MGPLSKEELETLVAHPRDADVDRIEAGRDEQRIMGALLERAQPVLHSLSNRVIVFMQRRAKVVSSGCLDRGRGVSFLLQFGIRRTCPTVP